MPLRRLLLHVGAPKTGTTAIQSELYRNRALLLREGILYPERGTIRNGERGHHNLAYEIAPEISRMRGFDAGRGSWRDVWREIAEAQAGVAVISAEGLFRQPGPLARVLQDSPPAGRTEIVCYLRRQDDNLESTYNQLARFARVDEDFDAFIKTRTHIIRYRDIIERWISAFPQASVCVAPYQAQFIGPNVVEDFVRRFLKSDVALPSAEASNTRAGLKNIRAAYYVRDRCRETLGPHYMITAHAAAQIRRMFTEKFEDIHDYSFMDRTTAAGIMALSASTNQWLAQKFEGFDKALFFDQGLWKHSVKRSHRDVTFSPEETDSLDALVRRILKQNPSEGAQPDEIAREVAPSDR